MRKRILELAILLSLIALSVGLFRAKVEPPRPVVNATHSKPSPVPSSRPLAAPTRETMAFVDPADFLVIRKLLGRRYVKARLGPLTVAEQAQFEQGELHVGPKGIWVDVSRIFGAGACSIWIAVGEGKHIQHEMVTAQRTKAANGWTLSMPPTFSLGRVAPLNFDLDFVGAMYAGKS